MAGKRKTWQDSVLAIGSFLFAVALIPTLIGPNKPAMWTSLMTATILTTFIPTYWTLRAKMGAVTVSMTAACWWLLFFQVL